MGRDLRSHFKSLATAVSLEIRCIIQQGGPHGRTFLFLEPPEEAAMVGVKQSHSLRKHIPTGHLQGDSYRADAQLFQGSEKH